MNDATRLLRYVLPGGTTIIAALGYFATIPPLRRDFEEALRNWPRGFDGVSLIAAAFGATILVGYLALNFYAGLLGFVHKHAGQPPGWAFRWLVRWWFFAWVDEDFLLLTHSSDITPQPMGGAIRQMQFNLPEFRAGASDALLHVRGAAHQELTPASLRARSLLDVMNSVGATATGLMVTGAVGIIWGLSDRGPRPSDVLFGIWLISVVVFMVVFWSAQRRVSRVVTAYVDTLLRLIAARRR